jgi:hypothetical protein
VDASWLAPCGCARAVVCGSAGPRGLGLEVGGTRRWTLPGSLAPCGCARAVVCGSAGPRGFGSGGRWSAQVDASWLAPCGCARAVVCGSAGPRGLGLAVGGTRRWTLPGSLAPCGCARAVVCGSAGPRGFGPGGRWNAQVDASWLAPCGCARAVVCGPAGPPGFGPRRRSAARRTDRASDLAVGLRPGVSWGARPCGRARAADRRGLARGPAPRLPASPPASSWPPRRVSRALRALPAVLPREYV